MNRLQEIVATIALGAGLVVVPASSLEQLSDSELDEVRGGFSIGGIDIASIGVVLETLVDDVPVLRSTLSLTSHGAVSNVIASDFPGAAPLANAADGGIDLGEISGTGLVISGNGGVTALVQDLSRDSIRNLIVNTANDRHIVQNTEITIAMPNLLDIQQQMNLEQLRSSLDQALNFGLMGASQ